MYTWTSIRTPLYAMFMLYLHGAESWIVAKDLLGGM
jgi:hypothetical protein